MTHSIIRFWTTSKINIYDSVVVVLQWWWNVVLKKKFPRCIYSRTILICEIITSKIIDLWSNDSCTLVKHLYSEDVKINTVEKSSYLHRWKITSKNTIYDPVIVGLDVMNKHLPIKDKRNQRLFSWPDLLLTWRHLLKYYK